MKTLQSELYRTGLINTYVEPKMESNFETLLINEVLKSEVSDRCNMIRKGIKEKFKLYNSKEKNGEVKILYSEKEGRKMKEEKYNFLKKFVSHLINNTQLKLKDVLLLMRNESGGNENTIKNFLPVAKYCMPEFIKTNDGIWTITPTISAHEFLAIYNQNKNSYWKRYSKQKSGTSVVKRIERDSNNIEKKSFQMPLNDLVDFLKNNKIGIDVSGKVDVNITVNIKFNK